MNIGFVSMWFERGASYVTKAYLNLLKDEHNVYIYARGGERYGKNDPNWDYNFVTWAPKLSATNINYKHFKSWLKRNNIDVLFFNEQHQMEIVYKVKSAFPNIKTGSYVDYYKESTVKEFYLFDFLICNTERHYFVFKDHPQCYYVPWGTDTDLFVPKDKESETLTFFHSAGMSNRKGTTFVVDAFIKGKIYEKAKLVLHTQKNFEMNFGFNIDELRQYNIEIIEETVTAPGLYYLGDVYVYPTMLDGLGLTMYEALSCGLPVITTNNPPMNEVIDNNIGYLVDVDYFRSRSDGYYWPLSIVSLESLITAMKYYVNNQDNLNKLKINAREDALQNWKWQDRKQTVKDIFENTIVTVKQPSKNLLVTKSKMEKLQQRIASSFLYGFLNKLRH